ncbi:hypothetical protein QBC40DRAFT_329120 [Triangularia verruculosa]|uniref:Biogenesis of lysosome-related organelles complex 1 subunit 1 n=1 Tax=Triangularia verruculosa TaxID=2587418 RepID=A0AAN6XSL1_9PEZI|nr:hypothetical protein QBC40DRAFT_329120 [Triangularia verruculosa]
MSSSPSSSRPSPATRMMLFRGGSSTLSAPEVSSVAVAGVTTSHQQQPSPSQENISSSSSRSRTDSVTSFASKGKSPLSLLSGSTPSVSGPSTYTTIVGSGSAPFPQYAPLRSSSRVSSHRQHQPASVTSTTSKASAAAFTPTAAAPPPDSRSIEEARTALLATLSNHFDREITPRAQLLHQNNAAIERQQTDLVKATAGLKKENDKLAKMVNGYSKKVKEVGDVQNWAEMLEREFLILEDTLRQVREGGSDSEEGSWTGSYSGSDWSGREDGDGEAIRPEEVPLPEPEPGEGGL